MQVFGNGSANATKMSARITGASSVQMRESRLRVPLKANADVVRKIADALLARRWISADTKVRIEGDELAVLLAAVP
jgi:hypothetical protein